MDPPRAFHVSQSASTLLCQKNTFEKNVEVMPSPF